MAWALLEVGLPVSGADLLVHTTVPLSSGLSSSAALEMATSVALEKISGFSVDAVLRARLGQRAENAFVGVNCGILDQYTSSVGEAGSALALDCRSLRSEAAHIARTIGIVICDTRARRELAGSQYGMRRAQCEEAVHILSERIEGIRALRDVTLEQFEAHAHLLPEAAQKRARFIIEENARVLALAHALQTDDRAAIAALARDSFAGARDLYEITIPEMERMMDSMLAAPGVIGARQAGAGFGGCMVAFVDLARIDDFAAAVKDSYAAATGLAPVIYPVRAAQGAGEVFESSGQ
jgi:galactokinase